MDSRSERTIYLDQDLLTSEDALTCLTGSDRVELPTPNVLACNNLDEYYAKSTAGLQRSRLSGDGSTSSKSSKFQAKFSSEPFAVPLVRNFDRILKKPTSTDLATSEATTSGHPKKAKQDVFTKAEKLTSVPGPLLLLRERLDNMVKVLIRRRRKVSYISRVIEYKGVLILFDKHMNIYLKDVVESFKFINCGQVLKRVRHRDDIMIRGDNIILVT